MFNIYIKLLNKRKRENNKGDDDFSIDRIRKLIRLKSTDFGAKYSK